MSLAYKYIKYSLFVLSKLLLDWESNLCMQSELLLKSSKLNKKSVSTTVGK